MQALIKFFQRWYVCVPAITYAATFSVIDWSDLLSLHAFGATSLLGMASLSAVLSIVALVLLCIVGVPVLAVLKLSNPGMLLQTLLGIVSGSLAIWLVGMMLPKAILLRGLFAAVPFATANTMTIWGLSSITGTLNQTNLLPKRRGA